MSSTGLLTIDTAAIAANWRLLRDRVLHANPNGGCSAVVKADAYGLGVKPVALGLQAVGCEVFFVATLDEAVELRIILGEQPTILVFGGLVHGLGGEWEEYQLLPVLIDLAHVEQWAKFCQHQSKLMPCAIKTDTGMHRLGISPEELTRSLQASDSWEWCDVRYFMSHLACADLPGDPLNQAQLEQFHVLAAAVQELYPEVTLSLANSSGLFLGDDFCFDMGRPGAALYGVNPTPGSPNPMQAVVTLELPVMQCRTIAAGETVGYGATFMAERDTRLATVFGGYADGLLRLLSNHSVAYVGDQAVPLVGRVSMDSLIFDVTDLDRLPSQVSILNQYQGVDQLADAAKTIGYEILTSLGKRYQRQYIG